MEDDQYSYNIRGWLKGVNYYNGTSYSSQENNSSNKWFAFDLSYDWGMSSSGQYNGNISGMRWKSAGDNKERAFGYSYDQANRLLKADFTQYNSAWGPDAILNFDVKVGDGTTVSSAYDENGNIKAMQQWGLKATASSQIDSLTYKYNEQSQLGNKLLGVSEGSLGNTDNKLGDFTDKNPGNDNDYTYDANGNLTQDKNKFIQSITYNHLNLQSKITVNTDNASNILKGTITYIYDALGNKLEKRTFEAGSAANNNTDKQTQTAYIGSVVYENNKLQFLGHEEGRIRLKQTIDGATAQPVTVFVYDYFLKDHLGNTRMVLSDEVRQDVYPAASLEDAGIAVEKKYYDIQDANAVYKSSYPAFMAAAGSNYANNNGNPPYNNNPTLNVNAESQKLYKLNGANGVKFGLGITLKVMAGDNVDIRAKSFYHLNTGQQASNSYPVSAALLNLLTSFVGGQVVSGHGVTGASLNSNAATTDPLPGLLNGTPSSATTPSAPKAGINWVLFDEQFRPVSVGFDPVDGAEVIKSHQKNASITQNGYLYVYCSDESNVDVFFDNLQVIHNRGALLEETHYYPFGLAMAGISSRAATTLENKRKFNAGTELNSDFDINTYETPLRQYDAQIGRFGAIDLLAEEALSITPYQFGYNNPTYFNDPTGAISQAEFDYAINTLYGSSRYGGYVSEWGGAHKFASTDEAFGYGAAYMSQNGLWGAYSGWAKSFDEALDRFRGGISPGMVQGFFEQRWSDNGRYDISAGFAEGIHLGKGFSVGYSFSAGSDRYENIMETVGRGSLFISFEGMRDLFRGGNEAGIIDKVNLFNGAISTSWGAKQIIMEYGAKLAPAIKELNYFKAVKVVSKGLFVAQGVISGIQVYNAFANGDNNKWGVLTKGTLDVGMAYVGLVGGPIGWAVSGAYFLGDAAGLWGNWGAPSQ
jgi:RHS repeat-associated protein